MTDNKTSFFGAALDRAGHDIAFDPQLAAVSHVFGGIQFADGLVIRFVVLEAGETKNGQCRNDDDRTDNKLDLFAFHGFNTFKKLSTLYHFEIRMPWQKSMTDRPDVIFPEPNIRRENAAKE